MTTPVLHTAQSHSVNPPRLVGVGYWAPSRLGVNNAALFPLSTAASIVVMAPGYSSFMLVGEYRADIGGALAGIVVNYETWDPLSEFDAIMSNTIVTWPLAGVATTRQKVSFGVGQGSIPTGADGFVRFAFSFFNLDDAVIYTLTARLYASGRR